MREMFPTAPLESQETDDMDQDFMQPGFQAEMDEIDPDFSVMPPVFPTMPSVPSEPSVTHRPPARPFPQGPATPVPPIYPPRPPVRPFPQGPAVPVPPIFPPAPCVNCPVFPVPGAPCLFCSSNQRVYGSIRMLNGAAGYNAFNVHIDNQPAFYGFEFAEVTPYRQLTQGYHTFSVMDTNGYVYLRKSLYVNDGMATIAIVNDAGGLDLTSIADTACPAGYNSSCFRVCNLAYFSGPVNVAISNIMFSAVGVGQAASFSRISSGGYNLTVARSARPGNTLINTNIFLNPNRIYTLYVLNWNQSADAVRTLLVEDRRG